jgi:hypothetical protein
VKDELAKVRLRRRLLGDPYAHIEQLIELGAVGETGASDVNAVRKLLENPYAFLNENGSFTLPAKRTGESSRKRHSVTEIEAFVTELQRRLWQDRFEIWPEEAPSSPLQALDVSAAAKLAGFRLEWIESPKSAGARGKFSETAGLIDRLNRTIRVSQDFDPPVQNFTAAHELGHAFLHPDMDLVHRDRALDGSRLARSGIEFEADKFATFFLMPSQLVRRAFNNRFGTEAFEINQDTAFALAGNQAGQLLGKDARSLRALSRVLAGATTYGGKFFASMARTFNVTSETMAIRLEEIGLVRGPARR